MNEQEVWARLETVNDAHVPVSLRKMGMIQDVAVSGESDVTIRMAIPCLACPAISLMQDQVREAVGSIDNIGNIVTPCFPSSIGER